VEPKRAIPNAVIAVVADVLGRVYYSHTRLNTLFAASGAPGDPPGHNCVTKCDLWLRRCNADPEVDAFAVLGGVLERFMEVEQAWPEERKRVVEILEKYGLFYHQGGVIHGGGSGLATRTLEEIFRAKDMPAVEKEFRRAVGDVDREPDAAVTAACAFLEALFKVVITELGIRMPAKQTIGDLYKAVRPHVGLDPGTVADDDMKRILSGLISVVDGIGSLRTHAGSAHGRLDDEDVLEPRHARVVVNAAHSLAVFLLDELAHRSPPR
jgi:hypothetical protein